jgi:hypothetical protein
MFLWTIVIFLFFRRFSHNFEQENTYVREHKMPLSEITGNDESPLTYEQVEAAFGRSDPPQPMAPSTPSQP